MTERFVCAVTGCRFTATPGKKTVTNTWKEPDPKNPKKTVKKSENVEVWDWEAYRKEIDDHMQEKHPELMAKGGAS